MSYFQNISWSGFLFLANHFRYRTHIRELTAELSDRSLVTCDALNYFYLFFFCFSSWLLTTLCSLFDFFARHVLIATFQPTWRKVQGSGGSQFNRHRQRARRYVLYLALIWLCASSSSNLFLHFSHENKTKETHTHTHKTQRNTDKKHL